MTIMQEQRNSKRNRRSAWNDLTPEFLEEYEAYMREEGKSQNTIGIYLRSLVVKSYLEFQKTAIIYF